MPIALAISVRVFADSELQEDSVIRNFRITAADGKSYNIIGPKAAKELEANGIPMFGKRSYAMLLFHVAEESFYPETFELADVGLARWVEYKD